MEILGRERKTFRDDQILLTGGVYIYIYIYSNEHKYQNDIKKKVKIWNYFLFWSFIKHFIKEK